MTKLMIIIIMNREQLDTELRSNHSCTVLSFGVIPYLGITTRIGLTNHHPVAVLIPWRRSCKSDVREWEAQGPPQWAEWAPLGITHILISCSSWPSDTTSTRQMDGSLTHDKWATTWKSKNMKNFRDLLIMIQHNILIGKILKICFGWIASSMET